MMIYNAHTGWREIITEARIIDVYYFNTVNLPMNQIEHIATQDSVEVDLWPNKKGATIVMRSDVPEQTKKIVNNYVTKGLLKLVNTKKLDVTRQAHAMPMEGIMNSLPPSETRTDLPSPRNIEDKFRETVESVQYEIQKLNTRIKNLQNLVTSNPDALKELIAIEGALSPINRMQSIVNLNSSSQLSQKYPHLNQ